MFRTPSRHRITLPASSLLVALVVVVGASPATAGERKVDAAQTANAGDRIVVELVSGSLVVEHWDERRARITGVVTDELTGIASERRGKTVRFSPLPEDDVEGDAILKLQIPEGVSLELQTVSARVEIRPGSRLEVIRVKSVSGDVRVGPRAEEVRVETVSGSVTVSGLAGRVSLRSVSGDLAATNAVGEVTAKTVSGALRIGAGPFDRVELDSVSGDIELDATLAKAGEVDIGGQSSDVVIVGRTPARYKLKSFSGDVDNQVGSRPDGPRVKVNTFSGDITVRAPPK